MRNSYGAYQCGATIACLFFITAATGCWADFPDSRFLQDATTSKDTPTLDSQKLDVGPGDGTPLDVTGDQGKTDLPTTDLPTTDLPTTDLPTTDLPTTDLPTSDLPTSDLPTTDLPTTDLPTTDLPIQTDAWRCTPGSFVACANKTLERCNTTGDGVVKIGCGSASCSTSLQRCDECDPTAAPTCYKGDIQTCSADGLFVVSITCPDGCLAGICCTDGDNDNASCDDCDDSDANAFPGQTAYFAVARTSGGYDYNCDTKEDPEFPTIVACIIESGVTCIGEGWVGTVPACGQTGQFATCLKVTGSCTSQPPTTKTQTCR